MQTKSQIIFELIRELYLNFTQILSSNNRTIYEIFIILVMFWDVKHLYF